MKKIMPVCIAIGIFVIGTALIVRNINIQRGTAQVSPQGTPPTISITPTVPLPSPTPVTATNTTVPTKQPSITLTIATPKNGTEVSAPTITIRGQTAPNAEVFVNDISEKADKNGNFAISITLDEGENTIIVAANDANGNFAEEEVTISYNPAR